MIEERCILNHYIRMQPKLSRKTLMCKCRDDMLNFLNYFFLGTIFSLHQMKKFDVSVTKMTHNHKIYVPITIHNLDKIRFKR